MHPQREKSRTLTQVSVTAGFPEDVNYEHPRFFELSEPVTDVHMWWFPSKFMNL